MMNLIEKFHAVLVSDKVIIWHYPTKKEGPKFVYWLVSELDNEEGYSYETCEQMIDKAYNHIDPLNLPLPQQITPPTKAMTIEEAAGLVAGSSIVGIDKIIHDKSEYLTARGQAISDQPNNQIQRAIARLNKHHKLTE